MSNPSSSEEELASGLGMSGFKPPAALLQASMARQSKIRLLQQERSSPALGTTTSVPASSSQSPQKPSAAGPNPKSTTTPVGSPAPVTAAPSPPAATSTPAPAQTTASPSTRASKTVQSIALLAQRRDNRRRQSELARKAQQHEAVANNGDLDSVLYRRKIDAWREKNLAAGGTHIVQPPPPQPAQQDDRTVRIKVCVRKRPLNARETADPAVFDILSTQTALIHLHEPRVRVDLSKDIDTQTFAFDEVFDEAAENEAVYTRTTRGLVEAMFEGGRGTVFAYGQTGSGKTHTVFGSQTSPGLCFYACRDVFHHLSSPASPHTLTLHASFFEIYTGQVYDLLSHKSRITLLEDHTGAIRIQGLTEESPPDLPSLLRLVSLGNEARTTGTTEANPDSSRSHAVLQLRVRDTVTGKVVGKFSMVDLAGSERATDRGVVGKRERVEGAEINKSLLALKECIRALHRSGAGMTTTTTHIPFRASKLTQILRDSFVGKRAQTVMIATVSPGSNSGEHSLNTLRYAWRVKEMKRRGRVGGGAGAGSMESLGGEGGEVARKVRGVEVDEEDDDDDDDDDDESDDDVDDDEDATDDDGKGDWEEARPPTDTDSHSATDPATTLTTAHETLLNTHISAMRANTDLMRFERGLVADAMRAGARSARNRHEARELHDAGMAEYIEGLLHVLDERERVWGEVRRRVEVVRGLLGG